MTNINDIIFYDTDWNSKEKEEEIIQELQEKYEEKKECINVYDMVSTDTLEEKLVNMKQNNLNTKDLKALIQYKASKILSMDNKGTLDFSANIEDIINTTVSTKYDNQDTDIVKLPKKYTIKDILEHPENQHVIGVFAAFFIAMIVIPIGISLYLNSQIMPYILPNWSKEGKENIVIGIGVGIAHIIGLIYVCYSWSGKDAEPDHIRDAREEALQRENVENVENVQEEEYEDESDEEDKPKISPLSSCNDKKEYLFIEREERESKNKDVIDNKGGLNELRNRKKGSK